MKRLREMIESVVFAGLKPSGGRPQSPTPPPPDTRWNRLRERIDLWISGGAAPSDPLYLTNRTTAQKLRAWSVVAVPLLILAGGIILTLTIMGSRSEIKQARELSPAEVAAKLLPNLDQIKIDSNHDVDVVEVRLQKGADTRMVGAVKNKTGHAIASADVVCELTDAAGTQLGTLTGHVEDIPPGGTKDFSVPVSRPDAVFVLIRAISSH